MAILVKLIVLHLSASVFFHNSAYAKCHFDACSIILHSCKANQECVTMDDCSIMCICPSGQCDNVTSTNFITSTQPTEANVTSTSISGRNCSCVHGTCVNNATSPCFCNESWFGNTCNVSCKQLCGERMLCIGVIENIQCIPDGVNDNPVPKNLSNADVCSPTYVKRPDSERSCSLIQLSCEFGVCIEIMNTMFCKCDLGATGQLCDQRCCRNCGAHGSCGIVPRPRTEMCNCEKNYTGAFCEIPFHVPNNSCNCIQGSCNDARTCLCNKGWTGATCNISCTDHCGRGSNCTEDFSKVVCIPTGKETTSQSQTTITPRQNACSSDYVLRPVQERECMGYFNCTYGTCVIQEHSFFCQCDIGVSPGQLCEHKCCKNCENNGKCYYHPVLKEMCNCDKNYTGELCEIYDPQVKYIEPEKVKWWFYLLVILIPILVMTLLTSLFLMYLWKRRVIVVLKAVRLFQAYEDDDERQWDAFISYRSNTPDEDYVIHTLFPKLTREMGFNVNVHYKDFIPGNEITNNIIYAVENSRRTILVVSPHYLTSNFTKMEWQLAQQKMLERKNKIIPILLEDISPHKDTIDPNLKSILDSVTYIEWPGDQSKKVDKFWQRLNLSMPKKKKQPSSHMNSSFQNGRLSQPTNSTNQNSDSFNKSFELDSMKPMYASSVSESSEVYNHVNEDEMLAPDEIYNIINEGAIDLDFKHVTGEQTRTEINNDRNAGNRPKAMLNVSKRIENDYVFKIDV